MTGYSRIKSLHKNESSSDCFLSSFEEKNNHQQSQQFKTYVPHSENENGDKYTEKFRRNASVSSSLSSSPAAKRDFSIKRSSSISDGYCRIHDQHAALSFPPDVEEFDQSFIKEKKSGRKRILKSCKRIFGL